MNVYSIPIIGWLVGAFFHISLAIPFYFIWNALAPTYFYWLPMTYQHLGFWETAGLFVLVSILKTALFPHFGGVSSSSGSE